MKKSRIFGKAPYKKHVLLSNFLLILLSVAVVTFYSLPAAVAQEGQEQQEVSQEQIEEFKEVKRATKKEKVEKAVKEDATGTDPRSFSDKWMPYYRYTELENGTLAQYRDFSDIPGVPQGTDAIGMGDIDLKFLWRPEALELTYGKEGKMNASVLLGTDFVLPTATDDALGGDAFLFAPIVAFVFDMPFYGFFAALNLYYFDVYKNDSAPDTSRYVGKWFYMQPLTKPGPWWGGFFLLPEFQPIYDFKTKEFSSWIGVELGKMLAPGRIAYIKPGWGIDNSELTDREFTFEVGFRWFF